jgi:hypothetical protein
MESASYIYQDQYIEPNNTSINTPSPAPSHIENFEGEQIPMDSVLMDFLNQQMAPAVEQFEKEQRKIKYYRTSAYYFSLLFMIVIAFFYMNYFIKIFGMKFKN